MRPIVRGKLHDDLNHATASTSGGAVSVCNASAVARTGRKPSANDHAIVTSSQPMRFAGRLSTRIAPTAAYAT
jgi:hypothetical protein